MTLADAARRFNSGPVPRLLMLTDERRLPDPMPALERLPRGAGIVLRHYGADQRQELARLVAAVVRRKRLALLVAGDWRLAAALRADGIHLPEGLARQGVLAPLLGWRKRRGALLTIACHDLAALARAARLGADAALLSPVFATASHPGKTPIGALRFRLWCRAARLPVHALGGIDAVNARRLFGAAGVAAIEALARTPPPS